MKAFVELLPIYENKLGIAFHNGITQSVINDINNVVTKILN